MENEMKRTKDYSLFKLLDGNREIKKSHVDEIKKSITEKGVKNVPILVNEKFEIIEGQHRWMALKELGLEVPYVMQEGLTLEDCICLNTSQKQWNTFDYIDSKAKLGMPQYQAMKDLIDQYADIPQSSVVAAFAANNKTALIKDGKLKIGDIRQGHQLMRIVRLVAEITGKKAGNGIIRACRIMLREGASLDLIEDSIKKNGIRYKGVNVGSEENAYAMLTTLYNLKRSVNRIDFRAYVVAKKEGVR